MNLTTLIIQLLCGAVGGNVAGGLMKKSSLGTLGNSIAGILGGGLGGQILGALAGGAASTTTDIAPPINLLQSTDGVYLLWFAKLTDSPTPNKQTCSPKPAGCWMKMLRRSRCR